MAINDSISGKNIEKPRILLVGLNEFNRGLLGELAEKYSLQNFQKLLQLQETKTITDDTYESDFLEPWVQWVSVQTGTPSTIHKIKHLGDIPEVGVPQIWEELSERGITSGVWGAMNANRRGATNCLFFLPDPWTFSEDGYPTELNKLLELPRYLAKNYLNLSKNIVTMKAIKLLGVFSSSKAGLRFLNEIPKFIKNLFMGGAEHFVFISFAEYMLTSLFIEYRKRYTPDFSFIFLNGIAHMQHHHWHGTLEENKRLKIGMNYVDSALGLLFDSIEEDDLFICTNALSQKNTSNEKPWILYRQKDQSKFLESIGLKILKVEPHMTHDAHIFFNTVQERKEGEEILRSACISGRKLFLVEDYQTDPKRLFYRINFTDEVDEDVVFTANNIEYRFFDYFDEIVTRTGKHIPNGTIFSNVPCFPDQIYNHQITSLILKLFESQKGKTTIKPQQLKHEAQIQS